MTNLKTYKNGLRLLHYFDNSTKAVSVSITCLVGGRDEDETNRGIAHLAEHMFFKGTKTRTARQINRELDKFGIVNNASTSNDLTKYDADGMNDQLELIFDVFSDCLFNSTFPQEELEKEKQVVCSELEMYENDFRDKAEYTGLAVGLQGTNYQYVLGGTVESVSKITTQDLLDFHNRNYTADRIIVSVFGNADITQVEQLVNKYFIPHLSGERKPLSYKQKAISIDIKDRFKFVSKETDQTYAMINFKSINASASDLIPFNIARLALASTSSSRLFIKLREEEGLVYVVTAYSRLYPECGLNTIHFISNSNNASKVLKIINDSVRLLLEKGFTEEEVQTYKNIIKTSLNLSLQTLEAKAYLNIKELIYQEKLFDLNNNLRDIDTVTLNDVNKAFRKYFDFKNLTIGVVSKQNDIDYLKIFDISQ